MERDQEHPTAGAQLGYDVAEHVAEVAERYCAEQREFMRLGNEPRINALCVEGRAFAEREGDLKELLRRTPRPGDRRRRILGAIACALVGAVLIVVAFFFALLSLEPFRFGITGSLVCLGIGLITPYAVHEFLGAHRHEAFHKGIVSLVFLCAVAGSALLADVRADLLARQVEESTPSVVIDGENIPQTEPKGTFYEDEKRPMRWLMILLALAIDLGAGIAIHRAVELSEDSGEDYRQISREVADIEYRLGEIVGEITSLTNAPAQFEAGFRRDFYRALLTQSSKRAFSKLLGIAFLLLLFSGGRTFGQERLNLVVAVDLSASENVKGHDGTSQFGKNTRATGDLLRIVPAGSKVAVIGITENSFGQPDILLRATVTDDAGYFGEKLASARQNLASTWQKRIGEVGAMAKGTDIVGAALLAGELLRESHSGRKVFILFSDMRNTANGVNLEKTQFAGRRRDEFGNRDLVANLHGVEVYVRGADAAGKGITQWNEVKRFWETYFRRAGSTLVSYSSLNEAPHLDVR